MITVLGFPNAESTVAAISSVLGEAGLAFETKNCMDLDVVIGENQTGLFLIDGNVWSFEHRTLAAFALTEEIWRDRRFRGRLAVCTFLQRADVEGLPRAHLMRLGASYLRLPVRAPDLPAILDGVCARTDAQIEAFVSEADTARLRRVCHQIDTMLYGLQFGLNLMTDGVHEEFDRALDHTRNWWRLWRAKLLERVESAISMLNADQAQRGRPLWTVFERDMRMLATQSLPASLEERAQAAQSDIVRLNAFFKDCIEETATRPGAAHGA